MTTIVELGLQLHLIIFPAVFATLGALAIIAGIIFLVQDFRSSWADEGWAALAGLLTIVAAIVGVFWALVAIPFDGKYYPLYSVSGQVESVSNGFIDGSGDSTYMSYVLTFEGDDRPYRIDDPRVTTFAPGDDIELLCTIGWVYQGADKWTCDIRDGGY